MKFIAEKISFVILIILMTIDTAYPQAGTCADRRQMWIDLYRGEPVYFDEMIDDMKDARVIYLCEIHSIERHHVLHNDIIKILMDNKKSIVLALEQIEAFNQPELDNYNNNKIDFNVLAERTRWKERWPNCADYRAIIENVRKAGGRIIAMNARAEIIKKIGRSGINGLLNDERSELPQFVDAQNPEQSRLLKMLVGVHKMMDLNNLQNVIEAQVARDETMADIIYKNLKSLKENEVIVAIAGSMHFAYGLGVPDRVKKLAPDIKERIILFSESGDLVLTPMEKAMSREIEITHDDLRFIKNPIADYLQIIEPEDKTDKKP